MSLKHLRETFPFGEWKSGRDGFVYCGSDVVMKPNFDIILNQTEYALSIEELKLSADRRTRPESEATGYEKRLFAHRLGELGWRSTQTGPWMSASVSYLQGCKNSVTVCEILQLNKLIRTQRAHADVGLTFKSNIKKPTLVTFSDASWACRKDGSSQGGQITILVDESFLKGTVCDFSILSYSSRKLHRVARSSTSAEVQQFGNSVDVHEFVKMMYLSLEIPDLDLRSVDQTLCLQNSAVISDSKNAYDALKRIETSGLQMEEKRTAIELLGIKERLSAARIDCRWVDSDQELADGLTKPFHFEQLLKALRLTRWSIHFDSNFTSAKRKRQMLSQYCLHFALQRERIFDRCRSVDL
jgi:hypothetical protein